MPANAMPEGMDAETLRAIAGLVCTVCDSAGCEIAPPCPRCWNVAARILELPTVAIGLRISRVIADDAILAKVIDAALGTLDGGNIALHKGELVISLTAFRTALFAAAQETK